MNPAKHSISDSPSIVAIDSQKQSSDQILHNLLSSHAQQLVDTVIQWHQHEKSLLQKLLLHQVGGTPNAQLSKCTDAAVSTGAEEQLARVPPAACITTRMDSRDFDNLLCSTSAEQQPARVSPAACTTTRLDSCNIDVGRVSSGAELQRLESIQSNPRRGSLPTSSMTSAMFDAGWRLLSVPTSGGSRLSLLPNFVTERLRKTLRVSRAPDLGTSIRQNSLTPSMYSARSTYARISLRSLEGLSSVVIILNSITIGVGADYDIKEVIESGTTESHIVFRILEVVFTLYYIWEIIMRMWVQGGAFCSAGNRVWNIFDLCLVIQACWDAAALVILEGDVGGNLSFLRMLRLFKMLKPLRMFRLLRFFRELRLILRSIFDCVKSVVWAVVLSIVMAYSFGLIFVQATTHYLVTTDASVHDSDLKMYWGSISLAVNSLFMTAFGGEDWTILANPLWHCGRSFYLLFLVYVLLFHLVLLNTISGLFCEAMISNAQNDQEEQITFQMEKKAEYTRMLNDLYQKLNPDGDGEIEYQKFIELIETQPELRAFAESLEIDLFDARQFFMVLSGNGKYPVDLEAFVVGCTKLKGCARSLDMLDLLYFQRNAVQQQDEFFLLVKEHLDTIRNHLDSVLSL